MTSYKKAIELTELFGIEQAIKQVNYAIDVWNIKAKHFDDDISHRTVTYWENTKQELYKMKYYDTKSKHQGHQTKP